MWLYIQTWLPFADNRFDCCNLFQRSVMDDGVPRKASALGSVSS